MKLLSAGRFVNKITLVRSFFKVWTLRGSVAKFVQSELGTDLICSLPKSINNSRTVFKGNPITE